MGRSNADLPAKRAATKQSAAQDPTSPLVGDETAAVASYIADMAAELARMAGGAQLPMLAYFLNLARVEADLRAREHNGVDIKRGE